MTPTANPTPDAEKADVERDVSWIGARLREPSTYAGLGLLLGALHFGHVNDWVAAVSSIGIGLGGIIAIVLPERARQDKTAGGRSDNAMALLALCVLSGILIFAAPAMAESKVPLPKPKPAAASASPTVAQAQQNPLLVLQQFTVEDLNAALADAEAQTPPDTTSANCYKALIPFVQQQTQNPLPAGAGIFQALQKARDAKAYLANIQSPTGPLAGLNQACAPLVLDVQNTLLTLGVQVGVLANPAGGAAAAVAGLPAAVSTFLNLLPIK
jgi:hypothetical protein